LLVAPIARPSSFSFAAASCGRPDAIDPGSIVDEEFIDSSFAMPLLIFREQSSKAAS